MKIDLKKWGFCLVLVSLAATLVSETGAYDADRWKARQARMVLKQGQFVFDGEKVDVEVYSEPEHQGWGRRVADWTLALSGVLYQRLGAPEGIDKIFVVEAPDLPSIGWNAQKEGVRLRYPAGPENIAEHLAHYWFHPKTVGPAWMQKGLASWEGLLALRQAGWGLQASGQWQRMLTFAMAHRQAYDAPLQSINLYESGKEQFLFAVAKATLFFQVFQSVIGERAYNTWIKQLVVSNSPATIADLRAALKKAGVDADSVLKGWIVPGPYGTYSWDAFKDNDHDGLPDDLEALLGTSADKADSDNDGLSDGYEYWHKLSPVDRDSDGDGKFDSSLNEIAVDGLDKDWEGKRSVLSYRDAVGDGSPLDLVDVKFLVGTESVFAALVMQGDINPMVEYWVSFQVDFNGDKKADMVVITDQNERIWQARVRQGQQVPRNGEPASGLVARHGAQVIEVAIPIALFEGQPNISVNVRIDHQGATSVIDHTGGYWQSIDFSAVQ